MFNFITKTKFYKDKIYNRINLIFKINFMNYAKRSCYKLTINVNLQTAPF